MGLLLCATASGLLVLPLLKVLPPAGPLLLAALCLLVSWWRWRRRWLLLSACFLASFCWSVASASRALEERIPFALEGQPVTSFGVVEGLSDPTEHAGFRFRFRPQRVEPEEGTYVPPRGALWLLHGSGDDAPAPGDACRLTAGLKRPHGAANPAGFDYEAWLLSEGIDATGSARTLDCQPAAGLSVDRIRLRLRNAFEQMYPERPAAGVVLALVSGDRALVPDAAWETYVATGIVHLMAISGLHVAMLSLLVFWLVRRALRGLPRLGLSWPLQKPALIAAFVAGVGYSLFAGYSIPTERTLIMMAVVSTAMMLERHVPSLQVLLLALLAVLLWSPLAVHAAGFWLSFGAVALLMLFGRGVRGQPAWRQAVLLQVVISFLLLPLTLWFFERVSWVSPFANLLAVPLVTFAIVPLGLAGCLCWLAGAGSLAAAMWSGAIGLVEILDACMAQFAAWPGASLDLSLPGLPGLVALMLALACLFQPLSPSLRLLAPLFLLPVLLPADTRQPGLLRLTLIDVGQGLSVLVETEGHRLLYDTGPALGPHADAGRRYVLPTISRQGIRFLDRLLLSHGDNDHVGGARSVMQGLALGDGLGAGPGAGQVAAGFLWQACRSGQRWRWDGWDFAVLYPDDDQRRYARNDNNRSCVLRISRGQAAVLLTGDLERLGELSLLDRHAPAALKSTVWVLGHHGSRTSTSEELLAAVRPELSLISAGYRNTYRHPSPKVLSRLEAAGIPWHNTASSGAITVLLDEQGKLQVHEFRRESAGYWQRDPQSPYFAGWTAVFALGAVGVNR
jgi:competence protein ComEC